MSLYRQVTLILLLATGLASIAAPVASSPLEKPLRPVLQEFCTDCHDAETKKGNLDLTSLSFDLTDAKTFDTWVKVHDRVQSGEMPPQKKAQPKTTQREKFIKSLSDALLVADDAHVKESGRAVWRRLNRYEYENTVRDLLGAPWLQLKDMLPEDGEAHRFNKVGEALDISHVQMSRYLSTADFALRQLLAQPVERPETKVTRYYAREQSSFTGKMKFSVFNRSPERATFAILGNAADVEVLEGRAPLTVGTKDPARRELESVGVVASTYEPLEVRFNQFTAPLAGRYKLRFNAHSFWAGPLSEKKWWTPDRANVSAGRRPEPVSIYSEVPPRLLRKLGGFDVTPEPSVQELDVWLLKGETIRPDAVRLFRSRPPAYHNPLAEKDGMPGVTYRWMEVEGPIYDTWPLAGQQLLFGTLPLRKGAGTAGSIEAVAKNARTDAIPLLKSFLERAYRQPAAAGDMDRFLKIIYGAMDSGSSFTDAMIAGYTGVLCSPSFLCLEETPGKLDDFALAERLSYFLWNSEPDTELRALAAKGTLHQPKTLRAQTDRLLADGRSDRFINAFLDYWLDLRKAEATSPDSTLYPDYYLDDLLVESSVDETRMFFAELMKSNLPAANIVSSDFAMLNERLALHYGLPPVQGVQLRRVSLPSSSVRGGLMTQASVLKVTANGTTTSPVLRGAWVMERILGQKPPPPPPSVPAIEPDIRGANTIRELLEKHRTQATCNACHAKIDPAGFALENFDVMGGWRDQYRALGEGKSPEGFGKNGQPFTFHPAQTVDASGVLPDGRKFTDIKDLKQLLLKDERQIARNLVRQFVVYGTGAGIRFGDRPGIEQILDRTRSGHYGVRSIIQEVVQSELFQSK